MKKMSEFGPQDVGVAGRVLIAVDPTGPRVAVLVNAVKAAGPHILERWDLTDPQAPARLNRVELLVSNLFNDLAFLASGEGVVVASSRGLCRWTFGPTLDQPLGDRPLHGVRRIKTDGRLVGLMAAGVSLWSADGTARESTIDVSAKYGLTQFAVSPDGASAAMASSEPYVRIVDLVKGEQTKRIACKARTTQAMDFSADGGLLVHGPMTAELIVRETSKWSEVRKLGPGSPDVSSIAFGPTGTRVAVSSVHFDRKFVPFAIYDAATNQRVAESHIDEMSWQIDWLDDARVLVAGASGRVHAFAL